MRPAFVFQLILFSRLATPNYAMNKHFQLESFRPFLFQIYLTLHQPIAHWMLYTFAFDWVLIGWSVRPQTHENEREWQRPLRRLDAFRHFAAEPSLWSDRSQKIFDRAFQELSIDVFNCLIWLKLSEIHSRKTGWCQLNFHLWSDNWEECSSFPNGTFSAVEIRILKCISLQSGGHVRNPCIKVKYFWSLRLPQFWPFLFKEKKNIKWNNQRFF